MLIKSIKTYLFIYRIYQGPVNAELQSCVTTSLCNMLITSRFADDSVVLNTWTYLINVFNAGLPQDISCLISKIKAIYDAPNRFNPMFIVLGSSVLVSHNRSSQNEYTPQNKFSNNWWSYCGSSICYKFWNSRCTQSTRCTKLTFTPVKPSNVKIFLTKSRLGRYQQTFLIFIVILKEILIEMKGNFA